MQPIVSGITRSGDRRYETTEICSDHTPTRHEDPSMFHPRCLSGLVTHDRKERILSKSSWMKPLQLHATGTPRKIVGYHLDERFDWAAKLECGHQQHVRHDPPWNTRHWVTS